MATEEEEKKPQDEETQKQDSTPDTEKDNQGEGSGDSERNPVELSKKRQRQELRRTERDNAVSQAKEEIQKLKDKDPETVDKFAAGVAQGFRGNFSGGGTTGTDGQPTEGNGAVPVQGIQEGGYSAPGQAPSGDPNAGLQEQERGQLDDIQPDEFAEPETTPETAPTGQPEASTPLTQQVNRDFNAVAAGVAPTNSAKVEASKKNRHETSQTTEQENKTFTDPAQEMFDTLKAREEAAGQDYAAAKEKYSVPNAQEAAERKIAEAEEKAKQEGRELTAKERRRLRREAERETEASLDKIYRELDPNYKSGKDFRREQNIKTIIGAIGKLGTMAGQAVTAANSGIILPTKSFSDGIMEDVRISDKERKELLRAYDEIRQAKINEPLARLQAAEKAQLDLVKSGAAYQTGKVAGSKKDYKEDILSAIKKKEPIPFKDWLESKGGGKKERFANLKNGEYIVSGRYINGNASGGYIVPLNVMVNQGEKLFGLFSNLPETQTEGSDASNIHTMLRNLKKDINGATDEKSKTELYKNYAFLFDEMLKTMENVNDPKVEKALDDYENYLKKAGFPYEQWIGNNSESADAQQGTFSSII